MHRVSVIGVRWPTRPSGVAIGEMNPVQGMSGRPNPYSIRDMMTKHEIAYRVRVPRGAALGRRRPRSSRRAGKPPPRRRGSGSPAFRPWRYTTCGSPKAALDVAEWLPESRALGNLYTRFGGGGGDGAAKQPRRPPTLRAAAACKEGLGLFQPREPRTCVGVVGRMSQA